MNQGTILVVDDTLASLKLLTDILTAEGYQVHPADSGELALASVAASLPELILLDIRMPGMDGFEVLRRLKAQERSRDIPVIMLTAFSETGHRVEGFKLGAVDFISKPFQHDELLARVHAHLELFRLRNRLERQTAELRQIYEQLQIATSAERKQADAALHASEARYKRITEGLTDYQYTVRIENGCAVETTQSPACVTVTGYTAEEFAADPYLWINMVAAEDRELVRERVRQILAGKDIPPIEHRIIRKDGEIRWVSDTTILFRDASGKLLSYDGVIKDITVHKAAEQELLDSANRLNAAQHIAHLGSWDWDVASGINRWSDEQCRIFGYEPGTINPSYDLFFQALHPEDRTRVRDALDAALDGRAPYSIECRILLPDGTLKHIQCLGEVERDAAGKAVRMAGTVRDITERKRVETALLQSEARYRSIVENSPMCIHEIDMEGRITSMNKAGLLMMGAKDESEVRGHLYLGSVCDADRERIGELLIRAYRGETSHFEFKSGGTSGWVFKSCFVPIRDKDGKVEKLMGITEDITERKQVEEKIRSLAFYDALTQLPNRRMLNDRLGQAMAASKRSGLYGALMFLDLDNFKPLNDTYGHEIGDLLLVEVARRLTGCNREMDTVARFGGDEFVVMLSELAAGKAESIAQASIVAEKIRATLAEPYRLARKQEGKAEVTIEHHCTSSIGVVLFIDHEASPEDIIKWADMAMYQAKDGGRNRFNFYA